MDAAFANDKPKETVYGSLFSRLVAYLLDCLILAVGLLILQAALFVVNPLPPIFRSGRQPSAALFHLWVFGTASIPFAFYFALSLCSRRQATFGMRMLKLAVSTPSGQRIGFGQALLRCAVMLLPFELNHVVLFYLAPRDAPPSSAFWLGVAGVWILIAVYVGTIVLTRRRQSVHDLIAGTVVRLRAGSHHALGERPA